MKRKRNLPLVRTHTIGSVVQLWFMPPYGGMLFPIVVRMSDGEFSYFCIKDRRLIDFKVIK